MFKNQQPNQWVMQLLALSLFAGSLFGCAFDFNAFLPEQPSVVSDETDVVVPEARESGFQPVLIGNEAVIEAIEVTLAEDPVQINAIIRGQLPDSCVSIERLEQNRHLNTFWISLITARLLETPCEENFQPFGEGVHLDTVGLPMGVYTVTAQSMNLVSQDFILSDAYVIPVEATPRPQKGTIQGVIWADFCQILPTGTLSTGCATDENGQPQPNGQLDEDEARVAGLLVNLSLGECPSNQIMATKATGIEGTYRFDGLETGFYCLSIDMAEAPNAAILSAGRWTSAEILQGVDRAEIALALGPDEVQTANFGWHYQAETTDTPAACSDAAAYVDDVTIPDDTLIAPGVPFTKTWRIRNDGDCTWGPGYALIFDAGDAMDAPPLIQFEQIVQPGVAVDLSVPFVAPIAEGTYRSDWKIQNSQGEVFGSLGDFAFYVRIIVREATDGE